MADDIQNDEGDWLAADDLGDGRKIPRTKLAVGADGVAVDVSELNPFPVAMAGAATQVTLAAVLAALQGTLVVSPLSQSTITATIASSASLSAALDCGAGYRPVRLVIPSSWTTANLTFQTSYDGTNFNDAYDDTGTEVSVTVGAASRSIILPPSLFIGVRRFKIRSGTSGVPVNQAASRDIIVVVQGL